MAKQKAWISLALATVLLMMAASSARGEAYAEFYLGGLQLFFDGVKLEEFSYPDGQIDHTQAISRTEYLDINQAVVFGLRAGTWFVPGGLLGPPLLSLDALFRLLSGCELSPLGLLPGCRQYPDKPRGSPPEVLCRKQILLRRHSLDPGFHGLCPLWLLRQ